MIYRCGQSTFSSCDHMGGQRKAPMDESNIGQKPQRIKIKADKNPKKRKYSNTPTIKVYNPISAHVITWYRCGQSTFSSCGHVGRQRKAPMDESTIRQKPQRIKNKANKIPKNRKYFNTPTIKVYNAISVHYHMIQVWTINILFMWSRGRTEKSLNGQKHHRTKAPKDKN